MRTTWLTFLRHTEKYSRMVDGFVSRCLNTGILKIDGLSYSRTITFNNGNVVVIRTGNYPYGWGEVLRMNLRSFGGVRPSRRTLARLRNAINDHYTKSSVDVEEA